MMIKVRIWGEEVYIPKEQIDHILLRKDGSMAIMRVDPRRRQGDYSRVDEKQAERFRQMLDAKAYWLG